MMRTAPLAPLLALSLALLAGPALSDPPRPSPPPADWDGDLWGRNLDEDLPDISQFTGFDVLPLSQAYGLVQTRFKGRLIGARLTPPSAQEHQRGAELVYELRLMTARRDVLIIRLDARSGDFLEVAGIGLTQARRQPEDRK